MSPTTASAAAAAAAPINTLLDSGGGRAEGSPSKRRRTDFDFSTYRQQHKEAAWTLATFSSASGATAGAGTATHEGAGEAVVAVTPTSRSTYPVLAVPAVSHALGSIQPQQQQQQQPLQQQHRGVARSRAPRPCLVVGPGQFGGQVGLLGALQPPELTKYLTVSEFQQGG